MNKYKLLDKNGNPLKKVEVIHEDYDDLDDAEMVEQLTKEQRADLERELEDARAWEERMENGNKPTRPDDSDNPFD